MELKFNKSTGSEEKVKLDPQLVYASWVSGRAIGGQQAAFEVGTVFVGNGAPIKITGKSVKGKKLGKVDGKIRVNKFVGELDIPADIEIGDEVYFEVKLPKNSLSGESDYIPAYPGPDIKNLSWNAEEARRGDTLNLTADAGGLRDGTEVTITIYEYDADGLHDKITEFPAAVENEKIEIGWDYEYHEDTDELPTEDEMQRYGGHYNPPEYFFTIKVDRAEYGKEQESGLLVFKDWIEITLENPDGQPAAEARLILTRPDGEEEEITLDGDGRARVEGLPPGPYYIRFVEEDDNQAE